MSDAVLIPRVEFPEIREGEGYELWASRNLNLAWLPRCDNWHNPSLFSATLPDAVYVENPPSPKADRRPVWFWRVDLTFGAWVCRTIHRAGLAGAVMPPEVLTAASILRRVLEQIHPECWPGVERASEAGRVVLPGSEIIDETIELARFGVIPRWDGWETAVARKAEPVATPDVPAMPRLPAPTRGRSRGDKPDGPKLF